ncbi:Rieske 2Fe-2S domain-containing protein [Streptomyces sp. NPDC006463]|uniref:Rieske 2Fe-2S domain-containing protein n=1 Tax=Streptomyces sp. NPDC006463 TaxID=3364746 RepID=UPI00369CACBD
MVRLAFSREVRRGHVHRVRFMGDDVVLYRTQSGVARAVDPYCPHLGAHLGYGGRVDGETIVCPFHGFAYDTDGRCVRTGYGTPPPKARLTVRHVSEVNGVILVWHHPDGQTPQWEIPSLPDDLPAPVERTVTLTDHPQEIVENLMDIGHLTYLHGFSHASEVSPVGFDGHRMRYDLAVEKTFLPLGGPIGFDIRADVHGLGYFSLEFDAPRLRIRGRSLQLPTAIDPTRIQYRWTMSLLAPHGLGRLRGPLSRLMSGVAASVLGCEGAADFTIWENKIYIENPRLAKGDGPIGAYRRWAAQFYPSQDARGQPSHSAPARHETDPLQS